jgi:hypothetical protein
MQFKSQEISKSALLETRNTDNPESPLSGPHKPEDFEMDDWSGSQD